MEFIKICALLGAGLAIGLGAIGSAIGEGLIAMKAVQSLGKQPQAGGKILRIMIIAQAITETAAIFALVISLLLLFGNHEGATIAKAYSLLAAGITIGFGTILFLLSCHRRCAALLPPLRRRPRRYARRCQ